MNHWAFRLRRVLQSEACVLVTVGPVRGSAPRSPGTRMLVSQGKCRGSIGGGNLEFTAINRARELLIEAPESGYELQVFGLGPALNQCCGGSVQVLFEVLQGETPAWLVQYIYCLEKERNGVLETVLGDIVEKQVLEEQVVTKHMVFEDNTWQEPIHVPQLNLYLFGAGHVGKALVDVLEPLPFALTWIDSREQEFPVNLPVSVQQRIPVNPVAEVSTAKPGSIFIVMTHSHELDENLCHAIMQRGDFAWLGLIGSVSKRRRFVSRLAKRGMSEDLLDKLICPIGISSIKGKQPATIAVAVAAQLLSQFNHQAGEQ